MNESDKILLRRYHENGDLKAREQLIDQYMSLVRSLARRYAYRGRALRRSCPNRCDRADQGDRPLRPEPRGRADDVRHAEHHRRDQAPLPRQGLVRARAAGPAGAQRPALEDRRAAHGAARPLADDLRVGEGGRSGRGRSARGARIRPRVHVVSLSTGGSSGDDGEELDPLESIGTSSINTTYRKTAPCSRPGFRVLDERERNILHLRFFEGLTQSQIAAAGRNLTDARLTV